MHPAFDLRIAVDQHVTDEGQQARRPVAAQGKLEQLRRLVDEAGGVVAAAELRMADQSLEKAQVGGDAADAELLQRPAHAGNGLVAARRPGGDLLQQRIIKRRDQRPRIGGAAVEAQAKAGGAAIGGDTAIVGDELVLRVLGGDAALQGVAIEPQLVLSWDPAFAVADFGAGGD